MKALTLSSARKAVVATFIAILILTVLEFPPPVGFETRPQTDVSPFWLIFFVIILVIEIATIPMIYKRKNIGVGLGVFAAILNILQVIADQTHLMQPEIAPFGLFYSRRIGRDSLLSIGLLCMVSQTIGTTPKRKSTGEMKNNDNATQV